MINDLKKLYSEICDCHICPKMDKKKALRNTSAVSDKTSVFIISQALAENQLRMSGVNFFGADGTLGNTGRQLEKFLNKINQTVFPANQITFNNGSTIKKNRADTTPVYNTEINQCFPGKAKTGDRKPEPVEIKNCLEKKFLYNELKIIKPKLLLLMGRLSITTFYKYVLKEKTIASTNVMINTITTSNKVSEFELSWGKVGYLPLQHASGLNPNYNTMLRNKKYIKLIRKYL